jgi:hypothetical protein
MKKPKPYRKCVHCNSTWVCWNWVNGKNDWTHECWDCGSCQSTPNMVKNGIPYNVLKSDYPEENKLRGAIRHCNETILHNVANLVKDKKEQSFYLKLIIDTQKDKDQRIKKLKDLIGQK